MFKCIFNKGDQQHGLKRKLDDTAMADVRSGSTAIRRTDMNIGREPSIGALRANAACFCITLDREELAQKLDAETGSKGFGIRLAASHPYLFANSPVFLATETMIAMKTVVAAVETAAALPPFRRRPSAAPRQMPPQIGLRWDKRCNAAPPRHSAAKVLD
mgnify:CR=1 FL=1